MVRATHKGLSELRTREMVAALRGKQPEDIRGY
jgi:ribosomal protein S5